MPTFAYEFNDENAPELFLPAVSFPYGAARASEIQYLFDLRATVPAPPLDPTRAAVAGDDQPLDDLRPHRSAELAGGAAWPSYSPASDGMLWLVPPDLGVETNVAAAHKRAFWDALRR